MKTNRTNEKERLQSGKRAGIVGFLCNLALSAAKIGIGMVSGALSVTADGLNNLSDAAASVITFLGFHFSSKPADREHPYGHARFEYLAGLTVSALMLAIAFEVGKSALDKILHPEQVSLSPLLFGLLLISVPMKAALAVYFKRTAKRIDSEALLAASADSRNDAITTLCVVLSTAAEAFTALPIDGYAGAVLSVFLFFSGMQMAKKTASPLLGEGGSTELQEQICRNVLSHSFVIGCHDLLVHDYGPGRCYATIHAETDGGMDAMECHSLLDKIERECFEELGVHLVIHHDPMPVNDPETKRVKKLTEALLKIKNEALSLHDFRLIQKGERSLISFDLVIPEGFDEDASVLKNNLQAALFSLEGKEYELSVTFDLR